MNLGINSIYKASEGEGIFIGESQIFVRFQGCTIGCVNCDSKETWDFESADFMPLDKVLTEITKLGKTKYGSIKRVSITGGDPLHPKHVPTVISLIKELKAKNYFINLEAAGTRIVDSIFDLLDFISFDYKTPSTNVVTNLGLLEKMLTQYPNRTQIKSVVANQQDFYYCVEAYLKLSEKQKITTPWCLTPAYTPGEEFSLENFEWIIQENQNIGSFFRVIGQQHKWVYGVDQKQV